MPDPSLALRLVRTAPVIAYDTETTGLDYSSVVCGYVITDRDNSLYIPVRHEPGGNIVDVEDFEHELAQAFKDRARAGLRTVGHSLHFDMRMSRRHGVQLFGPLEDTEINEGLLQDDARVFNLEDSCVRRGVTPKKGTELYAELARRFGGLPTRESMKHYWRLEGDNALAVDYATGDGVSTLALWEAQQPLLDERPFDKDDLRQVWKLECDLIPYVDRINAKGVKVSQENYERVKAGIDEQIALAKTKLPPGFNVRSPGEIQKLYEANGISDFAKTPAGKPSFTEKWLEQNEIGNLILAVRRLEKADSSFMVPLVQTNNVGGRVHPILHQSKNDDSGAVGGRFSCSEPNLQAFPKRNKVIGKLVRQLIVPDFGHIYDADFGQQEPRLFAHYSEDKKLIEGYSQMPPVDLHDLAIEITGRDRDGAKRLGMGILTMLGEKSLAGHMGYSLAEAKADKQRYLGGFPKIRDFQQLAMRVAKHRGLIRTLLGRIAHVDFDFAYKAVSRIIQGGGADISKTVLLRICQFAETCPQPIDILMTVHDSFMFQCEPDAPIKEMVALMEDLQTPPFNLKVPIPVEVGRGLDWAEASYGEKIRDIKRGGWLI